MWNIFSYFWNRVSDVEAETPERAERILDPIFGLDEQPLVSLEQACEPLFQCKPLKSLKQFCLVSKMQANEFAKRNKLGSLSIDEAAAINLYTRECGLYTEMNRAFREADRNQVKPYFPYIKLLLTAVTKLQPVKGVFYRGVRKDLSSLYSKGATTIWWSWSSCTTDLKTLESTQYLGTTGPRTLFVVSARGFDISPFSHYQNESEVLLLPARKLKVKSVASLGLCAIDLEEEQDQDLLDFILPPPEEATEAEAKERGREARERDAREQETRERDIEAREQERLERETREREAREKDTRERWEQETNEAEERKRKEEERRLELEEMKRKLLEIMRQEKEDEEKRRKEEEKIRKQEEEKRRKEEEEKRLKEEAEKKRKEEEEKRRKQEEEKRRKQEEEKRRKEEEEKRLKEEAEKKRKEEEEKRQRDLAAQKQRELEAQIQRERELEAQRRRRHPGGLRQAHKCCGQVAGSRGCQPRQQQQTGRRRKKGT